MWVQSLGQEDPLEKEMIILGEANSNSLQYSCLGNPMDRGAWGHKESDTTWQVNHHHHSIMYGIKY